MSTVLQPKIEKAIAFATWLHERTNEMEVTIDRRDQAGLSILQHSLDVGDGIVCLLSHNLPGPALSLARPLFESYVRGCWLLTKASDDAVENFIEGKQHPKLQTIIKQLGDDLESGAAWIKNNSEANISTFHDLVHGGDTHYLRHIGDGRIEPSYPDDELERYLDLALEIQMRIAFTLLSLQSDAEGIKWLEQFASSVRGLSR